MEITPWLAIYALAATRITGLIVEDTLTETIRHRIIGWLDNRPNTLGAYITKLLTCMWCAGFWVSVALTPIIWAWGDNPICQLIFLPWALSQVIGMISSLGR